MQVIWVAEFFRKSIGGIFYFSGMGEIDMAVIGRLNKMTIHRRDRVILDGASASIDWGARIAVIGRNGAGKSCLLQALASSEQGMQWVGKKPAVILMEQEVKAFELENIDPQSRILEQKWEIPKERQQLSGGEAMKLRLAHVLARSSDVYLLDEPTNHLDADSLELLAEELKKIEGTVIFVSHDRHFIDQVATHVWEIENRALTAYAGNYSDFKAEKEHRLLTQQRRFDKQQAKISLIENQLANLQAWSDKAHADSTKKDGAKEYFRMKAKKKDVQIRSKRQRLQAELEQDRITEPAAEVHIAFDIADAARKGRRVIELKDAGKSFDGRELFGGANFTIQQGERVGLLGSNGSGKSTLFKMLLGKMDHHGGVWLTKGMEVGYLSQDVFDIPEDKSPSELFPAENFEEAGKTRTLMDQLGFENMHWEQPVAYMSMGERVKLKLMNFMLSGCDVLLLDEPTNHLDLPSREELERTLASYGGTMLIATHDRYFMEKMTDKLLLFKGKSLSKYEGGYTEWVQRVPEVEGLELLQLERESQEVLGKLSFMKPGDKDYETLDKRFKELVGTIKALREGK